MQAKSFRVALAVVAVIVSLGVSAGEVLCTQCGAPGACQKVCRLVTEEKKVEVVFWGVKCEEFCMPGRCRPGCQTCETACGEGTSGHVTHGSGKKFVWTEWVPGQAQVPTKRKLMKKIVTKTVPSHKWVVDNLCSDCAVAQASSR